MSGIICLLFLIVISPFRMWDQVQQQAPSPDGRLEAVLSYHDGLTFGFQRVTIERRWLHGLLPPDEISEVASEGLTGIRWKDANTLVISYERPENEWVYRTTRWDGLNIEYERVQSPKSSAN